MERQVQIAIGTLLVLKVFFGFTVHELFFTAGALIGIGLIIAGITRWCGMARLLARLPWNRRGDCAEQTLVYPAHDYNGMMVSSIGEEKRYNPRLQVADKQAYIDLMNGLKLDNPRLMDIAVPANRACGLKAAA